MNNIDTIMYLIDWNRSEAEQQEGLRMAREVQCIRAFFQPSGPGYCKSVWENCATIICERSDEELMPHIYEMFAWLQDLNWPGALSILQRLLRFSNVDALAEMIEEMLPALVAVDETPWLMSIAGLLESQELQATLSKETIQVLRKYFVNRAI